MPPQAYALVTLFAASSVVLGWLAVRLLARAGGPVAALAYPLPVIAAFGALYLIGHRLGVAIGPMVRLWSFDVALLGDLAIGFAAALAVAGVQTAAFVTRRRARRPSPPAGRSATSR